jgi:general L-amino acid transport system substrate-binding protein
MMKRKTMLLACLAVVMAACTTAAPDTTGGATDTTAAGGTDTTAAGGTDTTAAGGTETTAAGATETTAAAAPAGETLAAVQERGTLICGVNDAVPGFGFVDADGNFSGFDIDFCRAVAAAVLGDPEAVEFRPLTTEQRFTALQSGEIDVLIRNTTRTAGRDGELTSTFLTTTFYDGQGMMVRADSGFESIDDMTDTAICTLSGTTTEGNLADRMGDIPYEPITFEENEQIQAAFIAGQCDGWTSDRSQLAGVRSTFPDEEGGPESLVIFDEIFSKEPLGPVVRDGDSQWAQVVDWVVLATIQAEEFGIDSTNVATFEDSDDPNIRRFLGLEIEDPETGELVVFDPGLGIEPGWQATMIEAVGNYAEIYERNVGPESPLGLEREFNALWTDGGLLYAPPYR